MRRLSRALSLLALSLATSACNSSSAPVEPTPEPDPTDALFDQTRVLEVSVDMASADWDALRHQAHAPRDVLGEGCQDGPKPNPYDYFPATVTVDGATVTGAGVRKKGFLGSTSISRPSLKISLDEYVAGQEISGLSSMTLNNGRQDASMIRQCLAFNRFREAGVPASRCSLAHVVVNGKDLGVYTHVEPVGKPFLRRWFGSDDGNLYEGQLSDFRPGWLATYERKNNEETPDRSDLDAVVHAAQAPDGELLEALSSVVDVDAFLRFWAAETLVAAWDGYTGDHNNHYVYHDPSSGKMRFIPWGPDISFDASDPFHDDSRPQSVSAEAILPSRIYGVPEGRKRYTERMSELLGSAWSEAAIQGEIDGMQAQIAPFLGDHSETTLAAVDRVRDFVAHRREQIESELSSPPEWPYAPVDTVCSPVLGTISGSFSTTWNSTEKGNPFVAGTGTFDWEIPLGAKQSGDTVGSASGPDPDSGFGVRDDVQIVGLFPDGRILVAVLLIDPEAFVPGEEVAFDWQSAFGVAIDATDQEKTITVGLMDRGKVRFDAASTEPGAPVTGTFSADILAIGL